jgi:hypothetical protein
MGLFSSKEKDELRRQLGKLSGMGESVPDPYVPSPEGRAMHAQIHAQAEHCLALLDKFHGSISRRGRDKLRRQLQADIFASSVLSKTLPPADGE